MDLSKNYERHSITIQALQAITMGRWKQATLKYLSRKNEEEIIVQHWKKEKLETKVVKNYYVRWTRTISTISRQKQNSASKGLILKEKVDIDCAKGAQIS